MSNVYNQMLMSHPESDPSNNEPVEEPESEVLFSACNGTIEIEEIEEQLTKSNVGWRLVDRTTNNSSPINPDSMPELIAMFKSFYQYAVKRDDIEVQAHTGTDAFTLRDDGVLEVDLYDD